MGELGGGSDAVKQETAGLSEIGAFARQHDPDRWLCAIFAPPDRREALFALIGLNHELARAREVGRQPIAVLIRLQWWRDAIAEAAAGAPARRHEVAGPLAAAIGAGMLDPDGLEPLIAAREIEAEAAIPDEAAFAAYLDGTAGAFAQAAGRALGAPAALLPALGVAGALYGLAGVLRNAARQGRSLLPIGADRRTLAAEGQARVGAARASLCGLPRGAIAAALPLVLARRDLARLAAGRPVATPRGLGDRLAVVVAGIRGAV